MQFHVPRSHTLMGHSGGQAHLRSRLVWRLQVCASKPVTNLTNCSLGELGEQAKLAQVGKPGGGAVAGLSPAT